MGYYRDTSNSLEKAQLDKKAHMAAKMYIKPGMKVLDIGCGWGGFALYLHKHYGCEVLGVALAPDQIAFCKERAKAEGVADKVKFALMDYRDVEGEFDRISSVGLLEHVGTAALSAILRAHRQAAQAGRRDVQPLLRPRRPAGLHRRLDAQVHLPRRLYPGPVANS